MSNQNQSGSYSSASYISSSSSDPQGHSKSITETMTSNDRDGTNIRRTTEETGKPTLQDETYIPPGDRQVGGGDAGSGGRRIEDVSDEQKERDREYEERMEEEYAKREGGA